MVARNKASKIAPWCLYKPVQDIRHQEIKDKFNLLPQCKKRNQASWDVVSQSQEPWHVAVLWLTVLNVCGGPPLLVNLLYSKPKLKVSSWTYLHFSATFWLPFNNASIKPGDPWVRHPQAISYVLRNIKLGFSVQPICRFSHLGKNKAGVHFYVGLLETQVTSTSIIITVLGITFRQRGWAVHATKISAPSFPGTSLKYACIDTYIHSYDKLRNYTGTPVSDYPAG